MDFVLVGGFAVGAHGHPRATKDVDIVPAPDPDNLQRLTNVLEQLEYRVAGVEEFGADEVVQPNLEGLLAGGNWVRDTKYGGLDIMQWLSPDLGYKELREEAVEDEVFGMPVLFCGYEHLVAMKKAAGRQQDIADLEALREVRGE